MKSAPSCACIIILLLAALAACGRTSPDAPPDTTPPSVKSMNPSMGEQSVPLDTIVTAVFNEPIQAVGGTALTLRLDTTPVAGTVSVKGSSLTFKSDANFAPNTTYQATVAAGVKDLAGNAMAAPVFWSFTTGTTLSDTTVPKITATMPANGAVNISTGTKLSVTFSEPVSPQTVAFHLAAGASVIPCTVSVSGATATFTPGPALAASTQYTATLAAGVKDLNGNAMKADYSWSFTTAGAARTSYTITASAGPNGSISPSGAVTVAQGATQAFTIAPAAGYRVSTVSVDGKPAGAVTSYTFSNVSANHTISATFAQNSTVTYTITASAGPNGSISPSGAVTVAQGGSQTFTLAPAAGYLVSSVMVDGRSAGAVTSYTFSNVSANHTISATFAPAPPVTHTVTASSGPNGSISPSGALTVNQGSTETFTITPAAGYHVATPVGGTCQGTLSPSGTTYTTSAITQDCTVSVAFAADAPQTVTVTASVIGGHGSISPQGTIRLDLGATRSFTLDPAKDYDLATPVGGTCSGTLASGRGSYTYTLDPVFSDCTVTATFIRVIGFVPGSLAAPGGVFTAGLTTTEAESSAPARPAVQTLTVTPVSSEHGDIAPDEPQEVKFNGILTFRVTPGSGYAIESVTGCGGRLAGNVYTTAPIREDCTIVVTFQPMIAI